MVREHSLYQTAGSMQGNTSRENRMVKVYSFMLMEKNLLGNTKDGKTWNGILFNKRGNIVGRVCEWKIPVSTQRKC